MQLRLFFPLWSMTTILGEVSSANRREINKLRSWGVEYLLSKINNKHFRNYPFTIHIKYFCFFDIETTSLLLLSAYIIRELGTYTFQSADYRVIPEFSISCVKAVRKEAEGCEITIESLRDKKPIQ